MCSLPVLFIFPLLCSSDMNSLLNWQFHRRLSTNCWSRSEKGWTWRPVVRPDLSDSSPWLGIPGLLCVENVPSIKTPTDLYISIRGPSLCFGSLEVLHTTWMYLAMQQAATGCHESENLQPLATPGGGWRHQSTGWLPICYQLHCTGRVLPTLKKGVTKAMKGQATDLFL